MTSSITPSTTPSRTPARTLAHALSRRGAAPALLALLLLLAGLPETGAAAPSGALPGAALTVGVLARVDAPGRRLWLADQELAVAPGADIRMPDGSGGSLYELKPGMRVRCTLERRGRGYRVAAVRVLPEGAPLLPPPPPELLRRRPHEEQGR